MSTCLVTGGLGFIGSHIVDELVKRKHKVIVIDSLEKQVHDNVIPEYINSQPKYHIGRLSEITLDEKIDYVFHCASKVGVAQSQYDFQDFTEKNINDTSAVLEKYCTNVKKIIHCGSMAPYGDRTELVAIEETDVINPISFYGITKDFQEKAIHLFGKIYNIPTISLRYFSVYGSRQAKGNPYAGPIPIFMEKALRNEEIIIFEDGQQTRDFIHVSDVVRANMLALQKTENIHESYNIGTSQSTTIEELAQQIIFLTKSTSSINITQQKRKGDLRHSLASTIKAEKELKFVPNMSLVQGLQETLNWFKGGM